MRQEDLYDDEYTPSKMMKSNIEENGEGRICGANLASSANCLYAVMDMVDALAIDGKQIDTDNVRHLLLEASESIRDVLDLFAMAERSINKKTSNPVDFEADTLEQIAYGLRKVSKVKVKK